MQPTSPIELTGTESRCATVALPDGFAAALRGVCPVVTDIEAVADASRDWWPLGMRWALHGQVLSTLRDQRKGKDLLNVRAPIDATVTVNDLTIPVPQIK